MRKVLSLFLVVAVLGCSSQPVKNDSLFPVKEGKSWGLINVHGEIVVPFIYDDNYYGYSEGLVSMRKNGKWCFLDKQGHEVIQPRFTSTYKFHEGVCAVSEGSGYGLINRKGDWVVKPFTDSSFLGVSSGLVDCKIGEKWAYKNLDGKQAFPQTFLSTHSFQEGLAGVRDSKSGHWGVINTEGKYVIGPQFSNLSLYGFQDGLCGALDLKTRKWGFINKKGEYVIKPQFDDLFHFSEGLCAAAGGVDDGTGFKKKKWGVINTKGEWVVKPSYEVLWDFREGRCKARLNGKWGFIDRTGNVAVPFIYQTVEAFHNGLARIERSILGNGYHRYMAYINKDGEVIWRASNYKEVEALIKKEEDKKPTIDISFTDKWSKGKIILPKRVQIRATGEKPGHFNALIRNTLDQDVFLKVTGFEGLSYELEKEDGSVAFSSGMPTDEYRFLYELVSKDIHNSACACSKQYISGSMGIAPKKLIYWIGARGTVSLTIEGYYKSNGKAFHESIDLPIEIVK